MNPAETTAETLARTLYAEAGTRAPCAPSKPWRPFP
jgi:hypothetical protein